MYRNKKPVQDDDQKKLPEHEGDINNSINENVVSAEKKQKQEVSSSTPPDQPAGDIEIGEKIKEEKQDQQQPDEKKKQDDQVVAN